MERVEEVDHTKHQNDGRTARYKHLRKVTHCGAASRFAYGPRVTSFPYGFEELDRVAGRVLDKHLPPARTLDGLATESRPGGTQRRH